MSDKREFPESEETIVILRQLRNHYQATPHDFKTLVYCLTAVAALLIGWGVILSVKPKVAPIVVEEIPTILDCDLAIDAVYSGLSVFPLEISNIGTFLSPRYEYYVFLLPVVGDTTLLEFEEYQIKECDKDGSLYQLVVGKAKRVRYGY